MNVMNKANGKGKLATSFISEITECRRETLSALFPDRPITTPTYTVANCVEKDVEMPAQATPGPRLQVLTQLMCFHTSYCSTGKAQVQRRRAKP